METQSDEVQEAFKTTLRMNRRTVVVQGPLAFRMQRLGAADQGTLDVQFTTLPLLAARLAGGFLRPAQTDDIESSLQVALNAGGFAQLEPLRTLPGMTRAAARTLKKVWEADVRLETSGEARVADLALLEGRVRKSLPPGTLLPRDLCARACERIQHAPRIIGCLDLDRLLQIPAVWRPLIAALVKVLPVRWIEPGTKDTDWFPGKIVRLARLARAPAARVVTCANPRSEVIEALRWTRQLLSSGRARAEDIAISAASTDDFDHHVLALARGTDLPIHFSNGIPALSTREGQACAALADLLINGLSQDRVRRLFDHCVGRGERLKSVSWQWAQGISANAGLFQLDHWTHALREAGAQRGAGADETASVISALEMLSRGIQVAREAGQQLLGAHALILWQRALRSAPAEALGLSLQALRLTDDAEAGASIAWCSSLHLTGAPRPFVWLLGLTSGTWPHRTREDPLLPDHLLSRRIVDPDPVADQERRAFELITAQATGECFISRSRRSSEGGQLPASPLLAHYPAPMALTRSRIPQHAFSETDRLLARPQEAMHVPQLSAAMRCWSDWSSGEITAHDGKVRAQHPAISRAVARTQSATSLSLLLRDPLGFVWRYALGWREPSLVEEPLSLEALAFGELVHELLRRSVQRLEPEPGFTRATHEALNAALQSSLGEVREQWPLERPTPPYLLWEHTLAYAEALSFRALTRDASFQPGTRCWTEVPFGSPEALPGEWPWNPTAEVLIPGTRVSLRGSIDRLDRNGAGTAVRVTDYKTGPEPRGAERMVVAGGASLQRVIYAIAATQLMPEVGSVRARLFYLGEDVPRERMLADIPQAIANVSEYITEACRLLDEGACLPGLRRDEHDAYRLALPAGNKYLTGKTGGVRRALGRFTRVWAAP